MSGRERERDRRTAVPSVRTNEYFVPKDGIDREVITADICRYLGNDALVRPGNYENPATRQVQAGYFITAYRNLTTAMIADLKADSDRWEAERRATALRGQPPNGISARDSDGAARKSNAPIVGYRDSTTHQSRQYYGPSEQVPGPNPGYSTASTPGAQGVYESGPQYQQQQYGQPASGGYAQPSYGAQDNYYVAGADLVADQPRSRVPVVQAGISVPRSNQYATTPTYQQQQPDSRSNNYYSGQQGPAVTQPMQQGYPTQPSDPYYGRGQVLPVSGASYDSANSYDNSRQYQDTGYSQPPPASSPNLPATSNTSSRRERDRGDPDPRDRHHRNSRR
ncbi:transcription factor RfeG [Drepanopeziza brunnea f. sp. 'multigermtubi' MB_m1]|uniref:Transcription factor RfeG n=1 Tax=Marssonina brunnea f. sp. multigermtubi (strain MB_m1) TaxID=1072389 RepID=K1WAL3_MARBU|nr:transcription factor RfeG [Drepanopeziza brunnea f. sp. 'multigermtubi' MB_m1]EKD14325.1 transcription factor RfeG [Drepanopeziza brunnea f. sp. 'multigermtubi' MB_m1]